MVLLLVVAVSAAFIAGVQDFLLTLFMAAIFSTMLHPLYRRVLRWCGGRRATASAVVLVGFVLAVGIPLILFMGLVASEAVTLSTTILPWIRERIQESDALAGHLPDWLPFSSAIEPYRAEILERIRAMSSSAGGFLFDNFTRATKGTIEFFVSLFVFLYAMFFFLMRGGELFHTTLSYLPLKAEDRSRVIDKGLAVTRATRKRSQERRVGKECVRR